MATDTAAQNSKGGTNTLLRNRNFMLLLSGQTVSWFGDALYFLSLLWLVQEMTGSKAMMGLVAVCRSVPALLGFVAGSLVDRLDKRKSMIIVSVAQACVIGSVPLLKALGLLQAWQIPVVAFLLASLGTFFVPARSALVPLLVEKHELVQANSLMTTVQQLIFIAGYSAGGWLIAKAGIMSLFSIDAASFIAVSLGIWLMQLPQQSGAADRPAMTAGAFAADMREGMRFVMGNRVIATILPLGVLLNFVFAPTAVFMPSWVKDILGKGADVLGMVESALLVGGILGAITVGLIIKKISVSILLPLSMVAIGVAYIGFSLTRAVPLAMLALVVFGFSNGLCNIILGSWMQAIVPRDMMGRVFGMVNTLMQIATPVGQGLGGVLAQAFPLPLMLAAQGVIVAAASLIFWISPSGREAFRPTSAGISKAA